MSDHSVRHSDAASFLLGAARTVKARRCRERNFPRASTTTASHVPSAGSGDRPTFNLECFPVQKCIGNGLMRVFQNSSECWPGDVHLCCRLFLLIAVQIGKAKCLELIQRKDDTLEVRQWNAPGLEHARLWRGADEALFVWSCHGRYERMLITKIAKIGHIVKRLEACASPQALYPHVCCPAHYSFFF